MANLKKKLEPNGHLRFNVLEEVDEIILFVFYIAKRNGNVELNLTAIGIINHAIKYFALPEIYGFKIFSQFSHRSHKKMSFDVLMLATFCCVLTNII